MDLAVHGLLALLGVVITLIVATFSRVLAEDVKAWLPIIVSRLIEVAVSKLPQLERDRYREEWHSHVNETPGEISKFVVAVGFLRASNQIVTLSRMEFDTERPRFHARIIAFLGFAFFVPLFAVVAVAIKVESAGPVFFHKRRILKSGRTVWYPKFRTVKFGPLAQQIDLTIPATKRDQRLTRIGSILRRSGIDELPGLISIARGELSLLALGYPTSSEKIDN